MVYRLKILCLVFLCSASLVAVLLLGATHAAQAAPARQEPEPEFFEDTVAYTVTIDTTGNNVNVEDELELAVSLYPWEDYRIVGFKVEAMDFNSGTDPYRTSEVVAGAESSGYLPYDPLTSPPKYDVYFVGILYEDITGTIQLKTKNEVCQEFTGGTSCNSSNSNVYKYGPEDILIKLRARSWSGYAAQARFVIRPLIYGVPEDTCPVSVYDGDMEEQPTSSWWELDGFGEFGRIDDNDFWESWYNGDAACGDGFQVIGYHRKDIGGYQAAEIKQTICHAGGRLYWKARARSNYNPWSASYSEAYGAMYLFGTGGTWITLLEEAIPGRSILYPNGWFVYTGYVDDVPAGNYELHLEIYPNVSTDQIFWDDIVIDNEPVDYSVCGPQGVAPGTPTPGPQTATPTASSCWAISSSTCGFQSASQVSQSNWNLLGNTYFYDHPTYGGLIVLPPDGESTLETGFWPISCNGVETLYVEAYIFGNYKIMLFDTYNAIWRQLASGTNLSLSKVSTSLDLEGFYVEGQQYILSFQNTSDFRNGTGIEMWVDNVGVGFGNAVSCSASMATSTPGAPSTSTVTPTPSVTPSGWITPTATSAWIATPSAPAPPTVPPYNGGQWVGDVPPPPPQPTPNCPSFCWRPSNILNSAHWLDYERCMLELYISMCPQHVSTLAAIPTEFMELEPMGSVKEVQESIEVLSTMVAEYNWNKTGITYGSDPDVTPTATAANPPGDKFSMGAPMPNSYMILEGPANSPYNGGAIDISGMNNSLVGSASTNCGFNLEGFMGERLQAPMCFMFNTLDRLALMDWIVFFLNVSCLTALFMYINKRFVTPGMY